MYASEKFSFHFTFDIHQILYFNFTINFWRYIYIDCNFWFSFLIFISFHLSLFSYSRFEFVSKQHKFKTSELELDCSLFNCLYFLVLVSLFLVVYVIGDRLFKWFIDPFPSLFIIILRVVLFWAICISSFS